MRGFRQELLFSKQPFRRNIRKLSCTDRTLRVGQRFRNPRQKVNGFNCFAPLNDRSRSDAAALWNPSLTLRTCVKVVQRRISTKPATAPQMQRRSAPWLSISQAFKNVSGNKNGRCRITSLPNRDATIPRIGPCPNALKYSQNIKIALQAIAVGKTVGYGHLRSAIRRQSLRHDRTANQGRCKI